MQHVIVALLGVAVALTASGEPALAAGACAALVVVGLAGLR